MSNNANNRNPSDASKAAPVEAPTDSKPGMPADQQKKEKEVVEPTRVVPATEPRDSRLGASPGGIVRVA
ncbi:hypothetical protein [Tahibacter caeni]|uniref:hypothetical protein n=1 Tax=Tahibacter caeni TaxID=1453545 RepID=UPI002147DA8E|nr:hypothetical protein [Tahibacter caeni]